VPTPENSVSSPEWQIPLPDSRRRPGAGLEVVVAAIKEETFPEIESRGAASVHWLSLGELSKLIETFRNEGVQRAIMAGRSGTSRSSLASSLTGVSPKFCCR